MRSSLHVSEVIAVRKWEEPIETSTATCHQCNDYIIRTYIDTNSVGFHHFKKMFKFLGYILLLSLSIYDVKSLSKRVLPTNENCDPQSQVCRKGDWIAKYIAHCEYTGTSCDARNNVLISWIVDVAKGDKCIPVKGLRFNCGDTGTNTRCVCSDPKVFKNRCKCQYWPSEDPGVNTPAFCTGYYTGGSIGIHHWACCNNCNDPTPNTCDGNEWQGGSREDYCGECGKNLGGGREKYFFNCGSCDKQQECNHYCSGIRKRPGLCWLWLDCFKSCCLTSTLQPSRNKRAITDLSFCGDGTCGAGESPATCPSDCCYQVNDMCAESNSNICDFECCASSSCCLEESIASATIASAASATIASALQIIVIGLAMMTVIL